MPDMPEDQVPRKERWERDHPDAEFFPPCEHDPKWHVRWENGQFEVKALHLSDLMKQLEKLDK